MGKAVGDTPVGEGEGFGESVGMTDVVGFDDGAGLGAGDVVGSNDGKIGWVSQLAKSTGRRWRRHGTHGRNVCRRLCGGWGRCGRL